MILAGDKIFPTQEFNCYMFDGDNYLADMSLLLKAFSPEAALKFTGHARVPTQEMSTPPAQLALIKFLIEITRAKSFLEIGTFIGGTAMHASRFMGENSHVVTIEKFDEFADIAQKNFDDNGLTHIITLLRGDAIEIMPMLQSGTFDFIYIDGDKGKYLELALLAEKIISPGGIIMIDDVFFHGDALNETPVTEKGQGCRNLLEHYKTTALGKYLLPIGNGILLLRKL